jgi:hypothetical protein
MNLPGTSADEGGQAHNLDATHTLVTSIPTMSTYFERCRRQRHQGTIYFALQSSPFIDRFFQIAQGNNCLRSICSTRFR